MAIDKNAIMEHIRGILICSRRRSRNVKDLKKLLNVLQICMKKSLRE